jgi:hypothetical protein
LSKKINKKAIFNNLDLLLLLARIFPFKKMYKIWLRRRQQDVVSQPTGGKNRPHTGKNTAAENNYFYQRTFFKLARHKCAVSALMSEILVSMEKQNFYLINIYS